MAGIFDKSKHRTFTTKGNVARQKSEVPFEAQALQAWSSLAEGFEHDLEQAQQLSRQAGFKQLSEFQYRISNPATSVAVTVTADLPARIIEYSYEPEDEKTAVPEKGILALRPADDGVELYSADQLLTPGQARKLILEPLLSPEPVRKSGT